MGSFILRVKFYSETGGTGIEVGQAEASASVLADGSLTVTISTYTGIQTIELISGQSVEVGQTKALGFTARDLNNKIVAQPPVSTSFSGAVFFTVETNPQNLVSAENGSKVRGIRPTEAMVTARIDSAASPSTLVKVTSATQLVVTPNSVASLGSEFPLDLSAVVTDANAGSEKGVTWAIVGGASTTNGQLLNPMDNATNSTVTYVAPKLVGTETRDIVVTATSKYNPDKVVNIPIHLVAPAAVVITPASANLSWEESINLTAVVNNLSPRILAGDTRRDVRWEIVTTGANVGTIVVDSADPNKAVYTAPKRDTTITVRAISNYDSTKTSLITITVRTAIAVAVTSPNPLDDPLKISVGRTRDFTVSVAPIPAGKDGSVSWTITGPNGESNATGTYGSVTSLTSTSARYTAPAAQPGTGLAKLIATSNYDTAAKKTINLQIVGGSLGIGIN